MNFPQAKRTAYESWGGSDGYHCVLGATIHPDVGKQDSRKKSEAAFSPEDMILQLAAYSHRASRVGEADSNLTSRDAADIPVESDSPTFATRARSQSAGGLASRR